MTHDSVQRDKFGSPLQSQQILKTVNTLAAKQSKLPIAFINDTKLQGFSPTRETLNDYVPTQVIPIPSLDSHRLNATYPKPTMWQMEQQYK